MFTHPHVAAAVALSRHADLLREAQQDALIRLGRGERPGLWRRFVRHLTRRLAMMGKTAGRPPSRAGMSAWRKA